MSIPFARRWVARTLVLLIAARGLWVGYEDLRAEGSPREWRPNPLDVPVFVENRMRPARHLLLGAETVGWANSAPPDIQARVMPALNYIFAPTLVDRSPNHRYILADFTSDREVSDYALRHDCQVDVRVSPGLAVLINPRFAGP